MSKGNICYCNIIKGGKLIKKMKIIINSCRNMISFSTQIKSNLLKGISISFLLHIKQ